MLHHLKSSIRLRLQTAVKVLLAAAFSPLLQLGLRIPLPALIPAIVQCLCFVCSSMNTTTEVSIKDQQ
jgi:hypothetical protein